MRLSLSLGMAADAPLALWDERLALAERCGIANVGLSDALTRGFECLVQTTLAAERTTKVSVGPVVTNPVTRHPAVLAQALASLQTLSGGRAFLGIGTGDSSVRNLGFAPARLEELRAYVTAFRALLRDGRAEIDGGVAVLPWAPSVVPGPVPVYLGSSGRRSLELAGEIADGVIVANGVSAALVADALEGIDRGARRSGRTVDDLDVWFVAGVNVCVERGRAFDELLPQLAAQISSAYRGSSFEARRVPAELHDPLRRFLAGYRMDQHVAPDSSNVELLRSSGLLDFFAERLFVGGTPHEFRTRIRELEAIGVGHLYFTLYMPDPHDALVRITDALR